MENFNGSAMWGSYLLTNILPFILTAFVKYQKANALPILFRPISTELFFSFSSFKKLEIN